jgi:hypothetical protein
MSKPKTDALAVMEPRREQITARSPVSFAPDTFDKALIFAEYIAKSDLAPKDFKGKPENVLIALQMGAEVGLAPMQSIQNIAVINGRPSLWGDAVLAIVQNHPAYEWHKEWFEGDGPKERVACFQIKRKGQEPHTVRFGWKDAAAADLLGRDTYKKYPDRMYQWRARSWGCRDKFSDALRGFNIAEEAMDMPPIIGEVVQPEQKKAKAEKAIGTLEPSKEPNRGHGNEGTKRDTGQSEPERGRVEPEASGPGDTKEFSPDSADGGPEQEVADRAPIIETVIVKSCKLKAKKSGGPQFYQIDGTISGQGVTLYCWHKDTLFPILEKMPPNAECVFELGRNVKDEGTPDETVFYTVEHIRRIGNTVFQDDKPIGEANLFGDTK